MVGFSYTDEQKKAYGGTEQVCRMLENKLPEDLLQHFQIIPSRIRNIDEDKIRIYWLHDLPNDPETNHLKDASSRDRFHKIVFCGNWQYNQYIYTLNIPANNRLTVIDTPITPLEIPPNKKPTDEIRLIYTSTPQRGLSILIPVFEELCKTHNNIVLDVFSSFNLYGWTDMNKQFEDIFERCRNHPKINYHDSQPNEVVREALTKAHIFAYPSIWHECNSRSLIEAMSAKCLCLHPNLAGLSDTSGGLTSMYQFIDDTSQHANSFYQLLNRAIEVISNDSMQNYLEFVKIYADSRFTINKIAPKWEDLLVSLLEQYKDPSSRAIPKDMFNYKTS